MRQVQSIHLHIPCNDLVPTVQYVRNANTVFALHTLFRFHL